MLLVVRPSKLNAIANFFLTRNYAYMDIGAAVSAIVTNRLGEATGMGKKLVEGGPDVERMLAAVLEISAWQAELVRAALRQIRAQAGRQKGKKKGKG
jgi:hypothetical protein